MTNAELFKRPGELVGTFVLSLFDTTPKDIDLIFYNLLVFVIALFFWVQIIRMIISLLRRLTGFERRR